MPWECAKRGLDSKVGQFELAEKIRMRSDIAGGVLILEAGRVSDLASIPSALEWVAMNTDDQRIAAGAWFHDYLYENGGRVPVYDEAGNLKASIQLARRQCDAILCEEAMPELGASAADRWKVSTGLLVGGGFNFKS